MADDLSNRDLPGLFYAPCVSASALKSLTSSLQAKRK
jgi:hypothetical protein